MKRLISAIAIGLVFTLLAIATHNAFLLNDFRNLTSPNKVEVLIEPGDTGVVIAQKLKQAGVIKAEKVFYKIAINDKRSKG
ncbi:MAG: ABC transporter substrate-binding protein, partial [Candidatus Nanopelagicus sp.]